MSQERADFNLLVIDDDEDHTFLIKRIVRATNALIDTKSIHSGAEAIQFFKEHEKGDDWLPNIVLLDLQMPDVDGNEVLKAIRALQEYSGIPVIMMTANQDEQVHTALYEAGANSIVLKKTTYPDMTKLVNDLLFYWLKTSSVYYV